VRILGSVEMDQKGASVAVYICPMHSDVRQAGPTKCPKCGMDLLPEGARFGLLRHMISSPLHIAVMGALMLALMAAAMMMLR
jgi:Heavy metal binding domain